MNNQKNTLNLIDIAQRAGVSRSTVSRVINDDPHVSDKTRQKVLQVISEVGYVPNAAARMLRTQRTHIIGVVIPGLFGDVLASDGQNYNSVITQAISENLQRHDYAILLWVNAMDESAERFYKRILNRSLMDGLIINSSDMGEGVFINELLKQHIPFIHIGHPVEAEERVSYVAMNNSDGAYQAVTHLLHRGRQRIGMITGHWANIDSRERYDGYQQALRDAGRTVDPNLLQYGVYTRKSGYERMQALLSTGVDAVFAGSDIIAVGAIDAIHQAGLCVPHDIAVIGFDDLPIAQDTIPTLTTVRHPIAEKASNAVEMLLHKIENPDAPVESRILPTELIIRESCGS